VRTLIAICLAIPRRQLVDFDRTADAEPAG
jgi:hypothetical protein